MDTLAPNGKLKVQVRIVGEDGNAFAILGRVIKEMKRSNWTDEEIEEYNSEATSGDYNHLLRTTMEYVDDIGMDDDYEDDDYEDWEDD